MSKRAIIYDFDGVIVDSVKVKEAAFKTLFEPFGDDAVSFIVAYHRQHGGMSRVHKIRQCYKMVMGYSPTQNVLDDDCSVFSKLVCDQVIKAPYMPGAYACISQSSKNVHQFIASGTPELELKHICRARGIDSFFKSVCGSPDLKHEIIDNIRKDRGYMKSEMLMVGDSSTDANAAYRSGIDFVEMSADGEQQVPGKHRVISDLTALREAVDVI